MKQVKYVGRFSVGQVDKQEYPRGTAVPVPDALAERLVSLRDFELVDETPVAPAVPPVEPEPTPLFEQAQEALFDEDWDLLAEPD
jgi:hypothetical protein